MKVEEIIQMPLKELQQALEDAIEELQNLRFQHATHQLNDTSKLRQKKRDIARMKTILREYELGLRKPVGEQ